jgi:ATP/maltotriose-dependent transcriptional regulator MalT
VTVVSASAGSGKTVLLRSWIGEAGLAGRAAWVPVGRDERDPQRFWLAVLGALRQTVLGSALVRELTAAPDLDGWAITERLLTDLAPLADRLWLVIDDVHELGSAEARRQLELLLMRAPPGLRFVLATRHDVRLGLHRLRLEGELTEIRADDLRFTVAETRELLAAAGVELTDPVLALLHERTEGWAAGLRLAALSLVGHEDPGQFAAEFSGSERTVAEYLLAEVLDRQSAEVRRLLLRTSVLDRVNGELANLLTGGSGGERVLQDLEEANAFVVSVDAARSWFRYHRLFAGLHALARLGETERAEQVLTGLSDQDREPGEIRIATAALRLARHDPHAASAALAPILEGSAPVAPQTWLPHAFLLEAIARDALGDPVAAGHALERALDLAEPGGVLAPFLLHPAPGLLERHARQRTAHAALIAQILDLLAGNRPAPRPGGPRPPLEPLSNAEIRVLRYLPTHLSAPEIAAELSVSTSTVKTHLRNLYAKLSAHSRAEAVESARALGLLAPSARSPAPA